MMPQPSNSPSTSDAESGADACSSAEVLTPQSSRAASVAGSLSPDRNEPVPSIEVADDDALPNLDALRLSDTTGPSPSPSPNSDPMDLSELAAALDNSTPDPGLRPHPQRVASSSPGTPSRRTPRRTRQPSLRVDKAPHRVRDEKPPADPFYDPKFQRALNEAKELMGRLAPVLASSDDYQDADPTIRSLSDTAQQLAVFQGPRARVVGLVGDSGVGKLCRLPLSHGDGHMLIGVYFVSRKEQFAQLPFGL